VKLFPCARRVFPVPKVRQSAANHLLRVYTDFLPSRRIIFRRLNFLPGNISGCTGLTPDQNRGGCYDSFFYSCDGPDVFDRLGLRGFAGAQHVVISSGIKKPYLETTMGLMPQAALVEFNRRHARH